MPGTYVDAMTASTPLGRAVRNSIEELHALDGLQNDLLVEAEAILKSVGFKGTLFHAPPGAENGMGNGLETEA